MIIDDGKHPIHNGMIALDEANDDTKENVNESVGQLVNLRLQESPDRCLPGRCFSAPLRWPMWKLRGVW